ncbi:transporter substrate-binding domain-containing protein [Thalassospira sp. MA62]|nr:transporter substrate-binding domain-containing protein [Thalassospira sp. MA62]
MISKFVIMTRLGVSVLGLWVCAGLAQAQEPEPENEPVRDCTHLFASGNPEYPPYLWDKGTDEKFLQGAAADFIHMVGERAGVQIDVVDTGSWSRTQQQMRDGTIDLIAGAFLTVPRLGYMDYFTPAFHTTRTLIWTSATLGLDYQGWSDLRGLEGLTVINNSFGQDFDEYAAENLTIRQVPNLDHGLAMLSLSRADYLIYEEFPGKAFVERKQLENLQSHDVPVSSEGLYVTMSRKSSCNTPEMRGRLSQAVFQLVTERIMDGLIEDNIKVWSNSPQ